MADFITFTKTYWQITPGPDGVQDSDGECWTGCCTDYDGFEVSFNSTQGNVKSALQGAAATVAVQDWTGSVY